VEEKRLLVLGAGPAQLGLLAAARRRGLTVVAADRDPSAPGFHYADRRAIVSVDDEPALERLARAERVDGLIAPGTDRPLGIAARIAEKLGVPHPLTAETANAATSRSRERERLDAAGVPQPAAIVCHTLDEVDAAADEIGYPCAILAADRQGQRGIALDPSGLAAAVAGALGDSRNDFCIVERLLSGPEFVVSGFARDGRLHALAVADDGGETVAGLDVPLLRAWPSAAPETVVDAVAAAATALGVREGPVVARVVLGDGPPRVARLAPRLGGNHEAELCGAAVGVDLNDLAIRAALGEQPEDAELLPRERTGGACVRFLVAPPGELLEAAGLVEAAGLPGVLAIHSYRRPGHVFRELRRASDRAGAVLAVGADRAQALERAARALELISFETVDAEALV
jgi:biotin carboxylase